MFKKTKNLVISLLDKLLIIRHFLKLYLFKSPMNEHLSFMYKFHFLKAKFLFKYRKYNIKSSFIKEAKIYNKLGYVTFTNEEINKNCSLILDQLKEKPNLWANTNSFQGSPTEEFRGNFFNIFACGVDEFIKDTFKSDYFIYYHILFKSNRFLKDKQPENSQLWHADGGPGTCMNLMVCHTPINKNNGALKIIPWNKSRDLLTNLYFKYKQVLRRGKINNHFINLNRKSLREIKCNILENLIDNNSLNYFQPNYSRPGTIFAFKNNCVHAGGYTDLGMERIVSIFHIYPSTRQTSLEEKFRSSHLKYRGFPEISNLL
mgnify:CR=1 FL=1